jgi:hypothetical protein
MEGGLDGVLILSLAAANNIRPTYLPMTAYFKEREREPQGPTIPGGTPDRVIS